MSSYMAYKVTTRTNLHCFRRDSFTVVRRFVSQEYVSIWLSLVTRYSDFLGLHEKLVGRYRGRGRIIPPAPEKSLLGTTRAKMGVGQFKLVYTLTRAYRVVKVVRRVQGRPRLTSSPSAAPPWKGSSTGWPFTRC